MRNLVCGVQVNKKENLAFVGGLNIEEPWRE